MTMTKARQPYRNLVRITAGVLLLLFVTAFRPAQATDPIRIGLSVALTGPLAANGKQVLLSMEVWKDDANSKGGLLGRRVRACLL